MPNGIVTRGMGTNNLLITRWYGLHSLIIETIKRFAGVGPSREYRKKHDEIIISAKLVEINDEEFLFKIEGHIRIVLNRSMSKMSALSEHMSTRIHRTFNDIVIYIKRVKRKNNG